MDDLRDRVIKSLLETLSYDEMTEEQEKLVTEYETEIWKKKIDEIKDSMTKAELAEQIHDWWLDYEFSDGTEENLLLYIEKETRP